MTKNLIQKSLIGTLMLGSVHAGATNSGGGNGGGEGICTIESSVIEVVTDEKKSLRRQAEFTPQSISVSTVRFGFGLSIVGVNPRTQRLQTDSVFLPKELFLNLERVERGKEEINGRDEFELTLNMLSHLLVDSEFDLSESKNDFGIKGSLQYFDQEGQKLRNLENQHLNFSLTDFDNSARDVFEAAQKADLHSKLTARFEIETSHTHKETIRFRPKEELCPLQARCSLESQTHENFQRSNSDFVNDHFLAVLRDSRNALVRTKASESLPLSFCL